MFSNTDELFTRIREGYKAIAPSILSADLWNLEKELLDIENDIDLIHFDVMDGIFVPNISFGFPLLDAVRKHSNYILDVHLMIEEPNRYFSDFYKFGADILTVHYEAMKHPYRDLLEIKKMGMKVGLTINPGTSLNSIIELIPLIDLLLIMTVEPGFGGQAITENAYRKVAEAREILNELNKSCIIEVDGGVSKSTISKLAEAGSDIFVAGSAIFSHDNRKEAILELRSGF